MYKMGAGVRWDWWWWWGREDGTRSPKVMAGEAIASARMARAPRAHDAASACHTAARHSLHIIGIPLYDGGGP